jgi:hypothetical protein
VTCNNKKCLLPLVMNLNWRKFKGFGLGSSRNLEFGPIVDTNVDPWRKTLEPINIQIRDLMKAFNDEHITRDIVRILTDVETNHVVSG